MSAEFDALGNIVGRYEAADPKAPVVMTGSHQDSVRNAGKYDGLFGIITAIACVKDLHERGMRLPYTLEIVGFGDEEGVRFGATLIGSKAMAGRFDPAWLDKTDDAGITMRQALVDFGGDPDRWREVDRRGKNVVAYVESHIEQGPVLLNEGLPVGVVTAIAGGIAAQRRASPGSRATRAPCRWARGRTRSRRRAKWCCSSSAIAKRMRDSSAPSARCRCCPARST